jgi:putative restriction endonuclease
LQAWENQCAFCGYDGKIDNTPVGIDAAHIRWFNQEGPDELDNGLALCTLHHRLLDRGVLGFRDSETLTVSASFAAVSESGKRVYDLHDSKLEPRIGTKLPASEYVEWHTENIFREETL